MNSKKSDFQKTRQWLATQQDVMRDRVIRWASVNSHTYHLTGVRTTADLIRKEFSQSLGGVMESLETDLVEQISDAGDIKQVQLGPLLILRKRPEAKRRALLVCHLDTVYPLANEDGSEKIIEEEKFLRGPGVTDAKGGIAVMLSVLEAFEKEKDLHDCGWTVVINADEEIGSPSSREWIKKLSREHEVGLVFEPPYPDGALVGERKGSGSFTIISRGLSAHAGRDLARGRNAVIALSKCALRVHALNGCREGLSVNVAIMHGGKAINAVPDLAVLRFNARLKNNEDRPFFRAELEKIVHEVSQEDDLKIELHGDFSAPAKPMESPTVALFEFIKNVGGEMGMDIQWRPSGGVCDGNRMQAEGLPTVDSLGGEGDHIHHPDEYLEIASLTRRAELSFLTLCRWAELDAGQSPFKKKPLQNFHQDSGERK